MTQITILSVNKQTATSAAGKPYNKLEVAYKDSFGKVASKILMPFGAQKSAFDALQTAAPGSAWTMTVVKKDKGYNDWTNAVPGPIGAGGAQQTTTGNITVGNAVNVKSNYETADERAKRQVLIVRQSSISSAVATLVAGAKSPPTLEAVLALANAYSNWVFQDPADVASQDLVTLANDIEVE